MLKPRATPSFHITDDDSFDYGASPGYTQDGPGTLVMDADAFLIADYGALLLADGPWTVTINGTLTATDGEPLEIGNGDHEEFPGTSVTLGATAVISGEGGVYVPIGNVTNKGEIIATEYSAIGEDGGGNFTINNGGMIVSAATGISFSIAYGSGTHTIINSGTIQAPTVIESRNSVGVEHVTNSGLMDGTVFLGGGDDTFTDFGKVTVGGKTVTHQGIVTGLIDLGDGNDHFTGGNNAETVTDGNGSDVYKLGGGNDIFIATGATGSDGVDSVDGGTGVDLYDASAATSAIAVNLDTKVHGSTAASTASVNGTTDKVTNFEDVKAGSGDDTIYGSTAANHISGGDGDDTIYGLAGNDVLDGGKDEDSLYGGGGRDIMTGGNAYSGSGGGAGDPQHNTFYYLALSDSGTTAATRDEITDFATRTEQPGFYDIIDLSAIDANTKTSAHDEFHFIGESKWDGEAGGLRYVFTATQTIVEADVNGDKKMDFSIALDGHHTLTAADFLGVI